MRSIAIIAWKEILDGLRNRWVVGTTILMAVLALTLAFLGSAPTGAVKVSTLAVTVVSLSSLTIFLLPLIALLLSFDTIVGDVDRGTMALLLTYPVTRWQVVLGKFLGHLTILSISTCLGYGAAGMAVGLSAEFVDSESIRAFVAMIGSSVLLGAAFISIGYLVSTVVPDRGTASGLCIGVWLLAVLVYDMALLGFLVADQGQTLGAAGLNWFLLANPADAFRLLNLTGFANTSAFSGMAGLSEQAGLSQSALIASLVGWIVVPLAIATFIFSRRQL